MREQTNKEPGFRLEYPQTDGERMALMLEFFLQANPHVKCNMKDITHYWGKMDRQQFEHLEKLLISSGLFIVFDKKGNNLFMLKDSARAGLIQAGSYATFIAAGKSHEQMTEEEIRLAKLRDEEDNIRKTDENNRRKKARENKIIMITGIVLIVLLIVIAKMMISKIK